MMKIIRSLLIPLLLMVSPAPGNTALDKKPFGDLGLGISIEGIRDFQIHKNLSRQGTKNTFWTVLAKKNERVVKVEVIKNIDEISAQNYIGERSYLVESLYKRIPSPYPGVVSNTIECPDKYKPDVILLEIAGKNTPVYLLYSTPRFTYGACADGLIKYRGALTFVYNEEEKILYRIEFFVPRNDFDKKEVLNLLASLKFDRYIERVAEKPVVAETGHETGDVQHEPARTALGDFQDYNLIIIAFDPLGANHIGPYGYKRNTAPNFDALSKKAYLFKNAISPSSWTLPVFMSWFTSLYPSQHKLINKYKTFTKNKQILSNLSDLSPSVLTLAQVLKQNGYATAGFTGGAGVGSDYGYNLGFDDYYDETDFAGFDIVLPLAMDWLVKHEKDKFFLFIHGFDVHGRFKGDSDNKFQDPSYKGKYKGTAEEYWQLRNASLDREDLGMAEDDVDFWRSWYDSKIYEADKRLGTFLDQLQKLDVARKTIIVISSASGNEFYEHKRFDHGYSLYDELIGVPLLIYIPGEKGRIIKDQVRTLDIMPTVLDILNIDNNTALKNQMEGVSLVPAMKGDKLKLNAYSETDYLLQTYKRSLRTPTGWKFIYTMDTQLRELYNLNQDPSELNNLADKEKRIAYELEQDLFNWLNYMGQDKFYHKQIMRNMLE